MPLFSNGRSLEINDSSFFNLKLINVNIEYSYLHICIQTILFSFLSNTILSAPPLPTLLCHPLTPITQLLLLHIVFTCKYLLEFLCLRLALSSILLLKITFFHLYIKLSWEPKLCLETCTIFYQVPCSEWTKPNKRVLSYDRTYKNHRQTELGYYYIL